MSLLFPSIIAAVLALIMAVAAAIIDRKHSPTRPAFLIVSAVLVGACSMFIAQFAKSSDERLYDLFGLIPMCWLLAYLASPIAGALIAIAPSIILIRKGYSSINTNLIVAAFTFFLGLFFFRYYGCF